MRVPACIALVSAVLLAPCAASGAGDRAADAWRDLFSQDTPAAAGKLDAVLSAIGNDVTRLRELIRTDAAYPPMEAGLHEQSLRFKAADKDWEVRFFVRVPAGYTPQKPWPMVLAAHGMGGNGQAMGMSVQALLGRDADRFVLVTPTMPGPPGWKAELHQQLAHLEPLAWVRRRLHIDDDRIYLCGYSQGGHLTWQLSTFYARLFAATVPMAGAPTAEGFPFTTTAYLQNHQNLAMWAIWGENDGPPGPEEGIVDFCRQAQKRLQSLHNTSFRGTELKGKGHGDCWPNGKEFVDFLDAHKRVAPPASFHHVFHMPYHARGYYVQALAFTRPPMEMGKKQSIVLPPGTPPTQEGIIEATRQLYASRLYRLVVQLDAGRNVLRIQPTAVRSVRVYLADGLLDLTKPVILLFAGRSWRGQVPVSPRCILEHYAATRDAARLILNEIDVDTNGRTTVRFK